MEFESSTITLEPILETLQMKKIEDRLYFSDEYKDYISNSRLGLINPEQVVRKDENGELVYGSYDEYKRGFDDTYRESFFIGSLYHQGFLQPEYFKPVFEVNRPSGLRGYIGDLLYNSNCDIPPSDDEIYFMAKSINYYKSKFTKERFIQLREEVKPYICERYFYEQYYFGNEQLMYMSNFQQKCYRNAIENLNSNSEIKAAMHPFTFGEDPISLNEEAIIVHLKATVNGSEPFILKLKAKLDNLVIDKSNNCIIVNDLKTHSLNIYEFPKAIINFHYYRELAIYAYLLGLIAKRDYGFDESFKVKGNFMVVTTDINARTNLFSLNQQLFEKGIAEYQRLIKMVAYYTYYDIRRKEESLF